MRPRRPNTQNLQKPEANQCFEGFRAIGGGPKEAKTVERWAKLGSDERSSVKMGIRWLNMGRMSDKMRQDGGKMRKMTDVPSRFAPAGG